MPPKKTQRAMSEPKPKKAEEEKSSAQENVGVKKKAKGADQKPLTDYITKTVTNTVAKTWDLGDGKFAKNEVKLSSWNVNGLRAVIKKGDLMK